ncbi:MAG TPA: CheR family methyltransferase [Gemmatimonadaceae bacterium]
MSRTCYVSYLKENPQELDLLFRELLIGVTNFFRDPAEWDVLKAAISAMLLATRPTAHTLRAWVAGCSTGEEAYSLAIVCHETLEALRPGKTPAIQIFATDLDTDAISRARTGVYPATIAGDVSPERLQRFFVESERGYQVSKSIREAVIFAPHDVTTDPPFTKLDVVSCRNLLIYLTPKAQHKLLPIFHYALKPQGILFLGTSETVGKPTGLFAPLDGKSRLFRRLETDRNAEQVYFAAPTLRPKVEKPLTAAPLAPGSLQLEAEQLLLRQFAPAAVLVNPKGDILFVSGRTGRYLEPAAGKANWNLFAMAREGLRQELGAGFRKAMRLKQAVTRRQVRVDTGRGIRAVDVTVQPIEAPEALHGMVAVVFRDAAAPLAKQPARKGPRSTNARVAELTHELSQAQRDVRTHRENVQNSREELSAVNEELQSSNEELQSTNEELTTSKEEMQSMNEELQTLNHELQARVDSLSHLTNDMKNLLDKTEIATVFLDLDLHVRLFTAGSSRIFPLMAGDVGRPITDFASALAYPALADNAREVLRTLAVHEQPAATRGGGWVLVRIMPYRTLDNTVDGVTITFSDITASREREDQLKATQVGLEQHIEAQARQIEKAERNVPADASDGLQAPDEGTSAPSEHEHRNPK